MVTDGTVDIGLVALTDTLPADLTVTPFLSDPFVAVVPRDHAFAARSWVRWEDFHGESFVGFNSVTSIAPMVRHALLQAGAETNEVQRADTVPAVGGLVAAGMGITAVRGWSSR